MSVIYITEHDENIYDVIKPPEEIYVKPPRYISSYNKKVTKEMALKLNKEKYRTMGPAEYSPDKPECYLKKGTGMTGKPMGPPPKPPNLRDVKLTVPKADQGRQPKKPKENFVKKNIHDIKKVQFKEPDPKYIDNSYGACFPLEPSGLKPIYQNNYKFGKSPNYLLKRMRQKEKHEKLTQDIAEIEMLPDCRYITRQEREELLNGLKKHWEETQKEFQLLPMIIDTIPRINRKLRLEKELQVLEKDIVLVEKYPYLYLQEEKDKEES